MADERRSDHQVADALGALIAGVESRGEVAVEEPGPDEELVDEFDVEPDELDEGDDEEFEDEADPTDDPEPVFMTLVDSGVEYPKTESEVQTLAQQGLHFTNRMQAQAERERAWEAQKAEVETELARQHQEYVQILPELRRQVESALGPEPDWTALAVQVSAQEYNQIHAQWQAAKRKLDAASAEQQRVQALLHEQQQQQMAAWRQGEAEKTLDRIPEWRDETKRTQAQSEIQSYLLELGLPAEVMGQIHDSVFWRVLHDAVQGRQAASAGSKEVERQGTKAVKPGSGKQKSTRGRRRQRQRERAKSSGKVQDIAPLMAELFKE